MIMIRRHKGLACFIFVLLLTAGMVLASPYFLLYATDYKKADAVILLLGPDFKARHKAARELVASGMADYLIISAYNKTYRNHDQDGTRQLVLDKHAPDADSENNAPFPGFYEDTHIEIIKAKKVMTAYGLKSAIFVSSPYHMRRIRFMAAKEFNFNDASFYFVPTRYEKAPANFWELSSSDWRKVRREYSKIIWFFIYSAWADYFL